MLPESLSEYAAEGTERRVVIEPLVRLCLCGHWRTLAARAIYSCLALSSDHAANSMALYLCHVYPLSIGYSYLSMTNTKFPKSDIAPLLRSVAVLNAAIILLHNYLPQ